MLLARLNEIVECKQLTALFQPIIDMRCSEILGYEGLIRGPSDSPLHSPLNLFKAARNYGMTREVEHLCRRVVQQRFAALGLPGNLFLNVSPECLLLSDEARDNPLGGTALVHPDESVIDPGRVIIELTENQPTYDYPLLLDAARHYREQGFRIAIDDLGEGFSSLRLWSELRPEYVKIDMHFVQGINHDPVKLQFVRSIQEIAEKSGTIVVAEGIETPAELLLIRDLGIACGQGYHIARPSANPARQLSSEVAKSLNRQSVALYPQSSGRAPRAVTAARVMRAVPPVTPQTCNNELYDLFIASPALETVPIVENGIPIGLVTRTHLIDRFARLYQRELYGRKSCTAFMDPRPLIVDRHTPLQDLSQTVADGDRQHLFNGFIVTDDGRYAGMGTGHDLMREITQLQISAARYSNPLTQLPGNVPIDEHIDRLLHGGALFHVCYVDLDHFKPFNDIYGYRKGDDVLQMTGGILASHCNAELDFLGHVGGDDFIVLFQSDDWQQRCEAIVRSFEQAIVGHFHAGHAAAGGYPSEDRRGRVVFHPLVSISLGVIRVEPGYYASHHQIAAAASDAKKQAKKMAGNSLFIERRQPGGIAAPNTADSELSVPR